MVLAIKNPPKMRIGIDPRGVAGMFEHSIPYGD